MDSNRVRLAEVTAPPLLIVESEPTSPEAREAYLQWQADTHVPEMLTVDGFASARRYSTAGHSCVTVYELSVDVDTAQANLQSAVAAGRISKPVAMKLDPPPRMAYVTPME